MMDKMLVLEYTNNENINELYGPKTGHSLMSGRATTIENTFVMSISGNQLVFCIPGTTYGFKITPMNVIEQGNKISFVTQRSIYCFRCV